MPLLRRQTREPGRGNVVSYKLDRFLGANPAVQIAAVIAVGLVTVIAFGVVLALVEGGDDMVGRGSWWALTRMLDGGNLADDQGTFRRGFGLVVTLVGLVAVAVLTGAFASTFAERLRAFRKGVIAVYERDHLLFLGWGGRGEIVLRELGASDVPATVVIVADQEREVIEERVRETLADRRHRLRIIVNRGDPTTTAALVRAAAKHARAIVILPELDGAERPGAAERADRSVLRSLLALRRVLRQKRVPTVVEVSGRSGRELVRLSPGGADVAIVDARDVNAHLLAHSVRQPGAYDVVRQILSLDARSIYLHPAAGLAQRTFDEAHAAVEGGVLVGLLRDRTPMICPGGGERVHETDRLLVFSDSHDPPSTAGKLPAVAGEDAQVPAAVAADHASILVVGYKPELGALLSFLASHGAARVTVVVPACDAEAGRAAVDGAGGGAALELVTGDPLDQAVLARATAHHPDVALLLAPDVPAVAVADADADQLITLLQLKRLRGARARAPRAVVEVRSPETERLSGGDDGDFIVAREVVGMLLAQELHALCRDGTAGAWLGEVYHRILEAVIAAIHLRPMALYAGREVEPSFGQLAARARRRAEVAIGVAVAGERSHLLPARHERFQADDGARVVVIGVER